MKKQLPTHDDAPSTPLPPKVIEVEAPNYEGDTRSSKYEVDENRPLDETTSQPVSKSPRVEPYPWPDDDIDLYAVDTRIWDRIGEMGGDGGGPHTHTQYSLTDHLHDAPDLTHDHSGVYQPAGNYADATHTHPEYEGGTGGSYDDTEVRGLIQDNADAIADLEYINQIGTYSTGTNASTDGTVVVTGTDNGSNFNNITQLQFASKDKSGLQAPNEVYVGSILVGYLPINLGTAYKRLDFLVTGVPNLRTYTVEQLTSQVLNKGVDLVWRVFPNTEGEGGGAAYDDTEVRGLIQDNATAINTKWGMWTGTQAEYDALGTYDDDTLYVVV